MSPLHATVAPDHRQSRTNIGEPRVRREQEAQQQQTLRPRLRVVDDSNLRLGARRRRVRLLGVIAIVVVVASLFGLAALHAVLIQGQVRVDTLTKQVAEEQANYQLLRRKVAELESPQRVVDEAVGRLGMIKPERVNYLTPPAGAVIDANTQLSPPGSSSNLERPWATIKPYLGVGS